MYRESVQFVTKAIGGRARRRYSQVRERYQRVAGPHWTADDMPSLSGKVVVVTGANSGIGYEAAKAFAQHDATVILACRNMDKAQAALTRMTDKLGEISAEIIPLDLASLQSIRQFAATFSTQHDRLDILVNNAGIMMVPYGTTEDGFERQLGTNHLGHFALTGLLIDQLRAAPAARVVTISSLAHRVGDIDFYNLNYDGGKGYSPLFAYGRSKLANLMFTYELQRRFELSGLNALALAAHPGGTDTNLGAHLQEGAISKAMAPVMSRVMQSATMGALPTLRAAVDSLAQGGDYFGPSGPLEGAGYPVVVKASGKAKDSAENLRLWHESERLTGVHFLTPPAEKKSDIAVSSNQLEQRPYETFDELRATKLSFGEVKLPLGNTARFVTRYDDVVATLKDPRFSNEQRFMGTGIGDTPDPWWLPSKFKTFTNNMLSLDDPNHRRLRNLVHKAFTPRMIRDIDGKIVALAHQLLDEAAQKPVVDLVADFALPLPLTVISEMMGVPEVERPEFRKLSANILDTASGGVLDILSRTPNAFALYDFFKRLVELRRLEPADDLTTALVQAEEDGDKLSEEELIAMLLLLLVAGHETTVNLISSGVLALLEHPEQFAQLKAQPELMDSTIEEMLRYCNPVQQVAPRFAMEDVDLNGLQVAKGEVVIAAIAAANRDETVFENADQFDITRKPNKHLAFGLGVHYCLGAPLARLEAKRAFEVLFERYPELSLAEPANMLEWRSSVAVRGLKRLPVSLE